MREILFRGKRMDNGEWMYGYYFQKKNPLSEDGFPVINCISDVSPFGAEVDPETVGQYTGFTDINGVKIFEGDIVKITDKYGKSEVYVVEFYMGAFALRRMDVEYRLQFIDFPLRYYDFEVIGNIYGNPELLKEGGAERDH